MVNTCKEFETLPVSQGDVLVRGPSRSVRGPSPDGPGGTPDEDVALTHWEGVKFLAGINHNTPFVFIHDINNMYGMLISCKALHWLEKQNLMSERFTNLCPSKLARRPNSALVGKIGERG